MAMVISIDYSDTLNQYVVCYVEIHVI